MTVATPGLARRWAPLLPALRVARFVVAVAIVVAMGVVAIRYVPSRSLTWWLLAPALAVTLVWWVLLARGWAILASGGPAREDMGVWCRTQVLRYLPGGIWAPTSRVVLVGGSAADRLATVAAENLVALAAALAVGGAAFALAGRPLWALLVPAPVAPIVAARYVRDRTRLDPPRLRRTTANALVAFCAYVAAVVLVQAAVSGLHRPLLVAGAAGISWAVGLVVVFTPGGLGARELAYAGLLAGVFPHGDVAAAAVVVRAVTIVAELLVLVALGRPAGLRKPKDRGRTAAEGGGGALRGRPGH